MRSGQGAMGCSSTSTQYQVSFAPILGLFFSYTRSLLLLHCGVCHVFYFSPCVCVGGTHEHTHTEGERQTHKHPLMDACTCRNHRTIQGLTDWLTHSHSLSLSLALWMARSLACSHGHAQIQESQDNTRTAHAAHVRTSLVKLSPFTWRQSKKGGKWAHLPQGEVPNLNLAHGHGKWQF